MILEMRRVSRPSMVRAGDSTEWSLTDSDTLPATPGTFEYVINVGLKPVCIFGTVLADGDTVSTFYEGATLSDNGTPITLINRDRTSPIDTPSSLVFKAPTISDLGTLLWTGFISGGGDKNSQKNFGSDVSLSPVVLAPETIYLFRLANTTAGAIVMASGFTIVEDREGA